jgi:stage II sporulation protein D
MFINKFFISYFFIVLSLTFTGLTSYAQSAEQLIRVGLSDNNFSKLQHDTVTISSTGIFNVIDKSTGSSLISLTPSDTLKISADNYNINIYANNKKINFDQLPLTIKPACGSSIILQNLIRKGKPAAYSGEIEINKIGNGNKLGIINILPIEDYLKGVVPAEIPVSFGSEAVKAQAIAARNYSIRPRTKIYHDFDVCDTVRSQVYYGKNIENPVSDNAIQDTTGLFALYDGNIILALYSSTSGGYTEDYENAFTEAGSTVFPSSSIPYLKGKPDNININILNTDDEAESFYTSSPTSFENESKYYRWNVSWTATELEKILEQTLAQNSNSGFITPKFAKNQKLGSIKNIQILKRGVSGKAIQIEVETTYGRWNIKKELIIRKIFQYQNKLLPSANIVVKKIYNSNDDLTEITFIGGGYGHGVGMSQYGAGFLSKNGWTFDEILQHYYSGISIGTTPVILQNTPVVQKFCSPNGKAELKIKSDKTFEQFDFTINSNKISLNADDFKNNLGISLDKYIINNGINEIIFLPLEKNNAVKVWVEVYKPKNEQ